MASRTIVLSWLSVHVCVLLYYLYMSLTELLTAVS